MPGRVEGKVAFITGAGRGQGRSHAIRLAEEGADIIAVDVLEDYPTVRYAMSGRADLEETVRAVQALGRRSVAAKADVRDAAALRAALDAGVAELGRLDIVCANAGIYTVQGMPFLAPYVATKHAVVGICRSLANELAGHHIRVNTVHPAGVDTPMVAGRETLEPFLSASPELGAIFTNSLPVEALDPRDVSNAVLWLASEEARYVTGTALTVDAGNTIR
jgi:NAD(P)-dependent dehydrogenase (short-subunit alcohol dehydrogenase family)